jgi:NAD(P)-dependent dehydrogenase (short-subunit alcohol dehydrogenase family)
VVLISGAAGGIGSATADRFASGGWQDRAAPITGANLSIDFGISAGV